MKLNRNNYEEYFILYMDNELGSEDRLAVEVFAQQNPDLRAELDMLLLSRLTPDANITFDNKDSLMIHNSSSISMKNYEEWLLTYADNELTDEERKDVERFAGSNPGIQKELDLLKQTILQPDLVIFPYKESLYRKEEKPIVAGIRWWKLAAAAVLLIGIGTTAVVLLNNRSGGENAAIAKEQAKTKPSTDKVEQPENVNPVNNNNPEKVETSTKENNNFIVVKDKDIIVREKKDQLLERKKNETLIAKTDLEIPSNNLPRPIKENPITAQSIIDNRDVIAKADVTLTNTKEIQGITNVTPDVTPALYPISPDDEVGFAQSDGKKNKLRGFFRKITRTFEKRTNIKATDEDDRLLIAGLAIKLN